MTIVSYPIDWKAGLKKSAQRKRKRLAKRKLLEKTSLPKVSILRKKLESIIHFGVKLRDKKKNSGLCLTCNAEPIYSANHIIPASESLNTRYDPDNIYGGGKKCNTNELYHRSTWAMGTFIRVFGADKISELHRKAAIKVKWDRADYQQKIEEAKKWVETL